MGRRRHGLGAVKRRSDGRWEGQVRLPDGSRKYVYARNRDEVIRRLQDQRWRIAAGIPPVHERDECGGACSTSKRQRLARPPMLPPELGC